MKQRLLGAAVLIALAIIFLPMFFSGPSRQPSEHKVALDIPPQPAQDMHSRTFDVAPKTAPAAAGSALAAPLAAGARASTQPAKPAPSLPQATRKPTLSAPAAKPTLASKPSPASKPGAPGRGAQQRFAVSVGVFANAAGAKKRAAQATKLGYRVFTQAVEVDGKPATGVRVGPYPNRAAAEAARLKLGSQLSGVSPALVAWSEDRTKDAPASAIGKDQPGAWDVQLAAFSHKGDAEKLRQRASALGFDAFVDHVAGEHGGTLWRVRVGPQAQRDGAEKLRTRLAAKLRIKGIVVPHR